MPKPPIRLAPLPESALLARYRRGGAYTDCYCTDLPRAISLEQYVEAFYTSGLFKIERALLARVMKTPADDRQARLLAAGQSAEYSAWTVEGRTGNELLLCDLLKRTRSWLMCVPADGEHPATRLYFGSAVVPRQVSPAGEASFGFAFHALHGFHHAYSRALLRAARTRLSQAR